jgi:hypothetical protein
MTTMLLEAEQRHAERDHSPEPEEHHAERDDYHVLEAHFLSASLRAGERPRARER